MSRDRTLRLLLTVMFALLLLTLTDGCTHGRMTDLTDPAGRPAPAGADMGEPNGYRIERDATILPIVVTDEGKTTDFTR